MGDDRVATPGVSVLVEDGSPRLGLRLQRGSEAHNGTGYPRDLASGEDLTRRDSNARFELERAHCRVDLSRGAKRSQGVVLGGADRAEGAEHDLARPVGDRTAMALDRCRARVREPVEEIAERLRIELVSEPGRVRETAIEDRDDPPLGPRRDSMVCGRRVRAGEAGILGEDSALQVAELLGGLHAELVERVSSLLVGVERLRLSAGPVEGNHQEEAKPLSIRILGHEHLELGDRLARPSCVDLGAEGLLEREDPQLRQTSDLVLREPFVRKVGQRGTAPELERFSRSPDPDEMLEPIGIELARIDLERVSTALRHDAVAPEELPQPTDVDLQRGGRRPGRLGRPELLDQPLGRNGLIPIQETASREARSAGRDRASAAPPRATPRARRESGSRAPSARSANPTPASRCPKHVLPRCEARG